MMIALVVCATLTACATAPQPTRTVPPAPPSIAFTPVALGDLEGREGLIFPDITVQTAYAGVEGYVAQCLGGRGLTRQAEPHGFSLIDPAGSAPFLRVVIATVSASSALGLDGTGLTPAMKEAIADTVQGRPRCAS